MIKAFTQQLKTKLSWGDKELEGRIVLRPGIVSECILALILFRITFILALKLILILNITIHLSHRLISTCFQIIYSNPLSILYIFYVCSNHEQIKIPYSRLCNNYLIQQTYYWSNHGCVHYLRVNSRYFIPFKLIVNVTPSLSL